MRRQKGFSLVELLIVVVVILIICAIAVPGLLRARIAANESSAVASLHQIDVAQISYSATYPTVGFTPDLRTLGPGPGIASSDSANAALLDSVLGCTAGSGTTPCPKSGYSFSITVGSGTPASSYTSNANPISVGKTGNRYFFSDSSGVMRFNTATIATVNDSPVQ